MNQNKPFVFEPSHLTGIDEVDRQHQHLLNLFNDAYQVLTEETASGDIGSLIRELLAYSIYHFSAEEALLRAHVHSERERDEADQHIAEHRRFSDWIVSLQQSLSKRKYVDGDELLAFLRDWIEDHVLTMDKALARLVTSRRQNC